MLINFNILILYIALNLFFEKIISNLKLFLEANLKIQYLN